MADKPQHEQDDLPLITAKEFQRDLNIGPTKFWADLKAGKLPPGIKLGPRTRRWTQSDRRSVLAKSEA